MSDRHRLDGSRSTVAVLMWTAGFLLVGAEGALDWAALNRLLDVPR